MKKNKRNKRKVNKPGFWKTPVKNQRWEIWGACAMISVMCMLLLVMAYLQIFPEPECEFTLNANDTNHSYTTCHHYNSRYFCCKPNPYITEYKNQSVNSTSLYDCKAVQYITLPEPYMIK